MDELIKNTLDVFGVPVVPGAYTGTKEVHISYSYSVTPDAFGDDMPEFEIYSVRVHVFAPVGHNIGKLRRNIRTTLFKAGFTFPKEINVSSYEKYSDGYQHYVEDCQYSMPIVWDEVI